jgi:hypothetical protein
MASLLLDVESRLRKWDGATQQQTPTATMVYFYDTVLRKTTYATGIFGHSEKDLQRTCQKTKYNTASKHMIEEVITGTPHGQRRTDILLDDKITTTPTDYQTIRTEPGTSNDHNVMTIVDSPLPFFSSPQQQQKLLPNTDASLKKS